MIALPPTLRQRPTQGKLLDYAYPHGGHINLAPSRASILQGGIDQTNMSFPAVISTAVQDRVGDVLVPEGCLLEDYALNPVVLYGHQEVEAVPFPIGKCRDANGVLSVHISPGRDVIARCFIARKGRWAEAAADVFHLVVEGVLNGVSVGFDPVAGEIEKLSSGGHLFKRWRLLEFSLVIIPCNQFAVVIRSYLERGRITGKRIHPMLVKSLAPYADKRKAQANGVNLPSAPPAKQTQPTKHKEPPMSARRPSPSQFAMRALAAIRKGQKRHVKAVAESSGTAGGFTVPEGHAVHKVRCLKEHYPEKPAAEAAVTKAGYKADQHEESGESHDFIQSAADAFVDDDRSEQDGEMGMKFVLGKTKAISPAMTEKDLQECVSRKIAKLIEEGYERDQAAAIAYKMCGEKCLSLNPAWKKDFDAAADEGAPADPQMENETSDMAHGAECAAFVIEYLEGMIGKLEPECKGFFEEVMANVLGWAEDRYPDLDFGGEESSEPDKPAGEVSDPTNDEEVDDYRMAHFEALRQLYQSGKSKSLHKKHLQCVRKAADFMDRLSEDKEVPHGHRREAWEHFKSLDRMHSEHAEAASKPAGDTEPEPEKPAGDSSAEAHETEEKAFAAVVKELETINSRPRLDLDKAWYGVFGSKLG